MEEFDNIKAGTEDPLVYTVKSAQKAALWAWLLIAFCAFRAANQFSCWMAWLIFFCRLGQAGGVLMRNEAVS